MWHLQAASDSVSAEVGVDLDIHDDEMEAVVSPDGILPLVSTEHDGKWVYLGCE